MSEWQPIDTAPCNDTMALAWGAGLSGVFIVDLDHDGDPQWWRERGVTHWMPLPEPPENQP